MEITIPLKEYLQNGGTLETLHKSGARIIDTFDQSPFTQREVGNAEFLHEDGFNRNGEPLYVVKYANGKLRTSLAESWIKVTVKVQLVFEDNSIKLS